MTDETNEPIQAIEPANAHTISKDRVTEAESVTIKYAAFAFGGGVIPFPMMDIAAVAGVQLKLLSELAKLYDVEFVDNWGKSSLAALVGGAMPHILAVGTVGSLIKAIPLVGSAIGFAAVPLLAAASTFAVGKVFIQHFESGGTFLDFDAATASEFFREQFAKGKELFKQQATNFRKRRAAAGAAPAPEPEPVASPEQGAVEEPVAAAEPKAATAHVVVEAGMAEADISNVEAVRPRRSPRKTTAEPSSADGA